MIVKECTHEAMRHRSTYGWFQVVHVVSDKHTYGKGNTVKEQRSSDDSNRQCTELPTMKAPSYSIHPDGFREISLDVLTFTDPYIRVGDYSISFLLSLVGELVFKNKNRLPYIGYRRTSIFSAPDTCS